MSVNEGLAGGAAPSQPAAAQLKVFISYRRADAGAYGVFLYEKLAERYGEANVFLDVKSIVPGRKWLEEIRSRGSESAALLALIGPRGGGAMGGPAPKPGEKGAGRHA